jgi:Zn finger protein HypA/HybF involved in hydrogenase expression
MFVYTIGDVVSAIIILIMVIWAAVILIKQLVAEVKCKHDGGVNETSTCDAICKKCGKNLGFIGNWRNKS